MTRWREATNATNPDRPVGERRSCQMTELDSDRARARALNTYLAALVVDGGGGCLLSTLRSCPDSRGSGKGEVGCQTLPNGNSQEVKAELGRGTDHAAFPASALFWFLLVDVEYTPTRNFMCTSLFYLGILCS